MSFAHSVRPNNSVALKGPSFSYDAQRTWKVCLCFFLAVEKFFKGILDKEGRHFVEALEATSYGCSRGDLIGMSNDPGIPCANQNMHVHEHHREYRGVRLWARGVESRGTCVWRGCRRPVSAGWLRWWVPSASAPTRRPTWSSWRPSCTREAAATSGACAGHRTYEVLQTRVAIF